MTHPLNSLMEQFDRTQVFLHTMTCSANGWSPSLIHPREAGEQSSYFYIWDRPTSWTWACAIPVANVASLSKLIAAQPADWESIRGALAHEIAQAAAASALDPDLEHRLGFLVTAYASTTQTMAAATRQMPGGCHFIVCNYRKPTERDGRLRPFAAPLRHRALLPAHELLASVSKVLELDEANHPEWFV